MAHSAILDWHLNRFQVSRQNPTTRQPILAVLVRLVCMRALCLKFLYYFYHERNHYVYQATISLYKTSNYLFDLGYIVCLMNVNCLCREWFSCNKTHATIYYFCLYYPYSALMVYLALYVDLHLGYVISRTITLRKYKRKQLKKYTWLK